MKAVELKAYREAKVIDAGLKVQVLAREERCARELEDALSSLGSIHHAVRCYRGSHPLHEINGSLPDVVVLEVGDCHEDCIDDIRQFVEAHGRSCEVFVTVPDADLSLVKQLVRSGVRDVLSQPVNKQDLAIALSSAVARQGLASDTKITKRGDVIAFMSTRGNTGGSLLAVNMAYQLAERFGKKTVLVDLDIQFGTVASELDLEPDGGLLEALHNPERVDSVFLNSLVTRHGSGMAVLPSPGDLGYYEQVDALAVSRLISVLAETYEHVVINLPVCLNEAIEQVFSLSHPAYLVTEDTLSALRNLRMMLQRLPARGIPLAHLEIIHYRIDKKLKDISDGDLQTLLGDVPLHMVRGDYRMTALAANAGKAVSELYPGAELVKDIHAIAADVSGTRHREEPRKRGGLRAYFAKQHKDDSTG